MAQAQKASSPRFRGVMSFTGVHPLDDNGVLTRVPRWSFRHVLRYTFVFQGRMLEYLSYRHCQLEVVWTFC